MKIPDHFVDLFEKRAFAHLVTLMPDGSPQVTPVWVDYDPRSAEGDPRSAEGDGAYILINTALRRQKERNVRRNPQVALAISDPDDPYRFMQVRGTVVEITAEGAKAHIDKMAKKYQGLDVYPNHSPDWPRVILKIRADHVSGSAR
ncbi:MAG: PPOX class F420-dependent oxidoreductase [Chloroflexi bacterium]|nr:PPOX class F420-dependent oxidoreductase [Chloroflexota bacterium]